MAVPLVGKIAIVVLTLGVIAGLTTVIVLTVNSGDSVEDDCCVVEELEPIYEVGVGIADMTGPPVEINFMGYAEFTQSGTGLHLRQFSRAFIFVEGDKRIVYVSAEVQAVGIAVRREVVKRLQEKYGDMYRLDNVIIAGTHTHSAPGGHLVYILLDISILGFSEESFDAYVDGITRSIERAHENIVPARLFYGRTNVTDASINRSPFSYMANPPAERARYDHNTDKVLTQVRIETVNGTLHGVLNWFSVHTTSMNMSNTLISSDNLGYSALRMEQELNPGSSPGKAKVVAGFFASNLGDVSPNTYGARCEFSGIECDNQFVVCGAGERCFAPGPGDDMFESVKIIGTKIYDGAMEILNSPGVELRGKLKVVHQFVDMTVQEVPRYNPVTRSFESNETVPGCAPALGYSFVAGTQDGANTLNVTQGTLHPVEGNPVLGIINIISNPTDWDRECHAPKPILLATGRSDDPLPWHPNIISASLIWLGDLAILGVPGEPTTMAGRRMMDVVGRVMQENGIDPKVVVTGLTNDYIHYVSTFEEYQIQRYEAASTIYGPHTLDIFLNKFHEYAEIAIKDGAAENTSEPEDYRSRITTFIPPAVVDNPEANSVFGQTLYQPENEAPRGATIEAVFVAANPRNDLRHESSYFVIERLNGTDWIEVANDADFNTMFIWQRMLQDTSRVQIQWTIPEDAILGVPHKIRYFGAAKTASGDFQPFIGESNTFTIV